MDFSKIILQGEEYTVKDVESRTRLDNVDNILNEHDEEFEEIKNKIDSNSIIDVDELPTPNNAELGKIYRYHNVLYTLDAYSYPPIYAILSKNSESETGIITVDELPNPSLNTLGQLYKYNKGLYTCVISGSKEFIGDYDSLNPLPCKYDNVADLVAYLDTLQIGYNNAGDGDLQPYDLCTVFDSDVEMEERFIIYKTSEDVNGYLISNVIDTSVGSINVTKTWTLEEWVNGEINLGEWVCAGGGYSWDVVGLISISDAMREICTTVSYTFVEIADKKYVDDKLSEQIYKHIESITTDSVTNRIVREDFNYNNIFIKFNVGQATATTPIQILINKSVLFKINNAVNSSWPACSTGEIKWIESMGVYKFTATQNTNAFQNLANVTTGWNFNANNKITSIDIYTADSSNFPEGSTIDIYGV